MEWTKWENQLRNTLIANSEYINYVQVIYSLVTDGSKSTNPMFGIVTA